MKAILANPSLYIIFFLFSFSYCKHEWNLWVMVITKETTSLKREDTDLKNKCGLPWGLAARPVLDDVENLPSVPFLASLGSLCRGF